MDTVDIRKTIIPFSLLQITNRFKRMQAGSVIEIIGSDENVITELKSLLPAAHYELILAEAMSAGSPCFRLWLKKKRPKPSDPRRSVMSAIDLTTIEVSSTVDARGSACPGPLLEAKKGIGKVNIGEVLEIYSNDAGTRSDIPAWSRKVGHEYMGVLEVDGYDKHFIRRNK